MGCVFIESTIKINIDFRMDVVCDRHYSKVSFIFLALGTLWTFKYLVLGQFTTRKILKTTTKPTAFSGKWRTEVS